MSILLQDNKTRSQIAIVEKRKRKQRFLSFQNHYKIKENPIDTFNNLCQTVNNKTATGDIMKHLISITLISALITGQLCGMSETAHTNQRHDELIYQDEMQRIGTTFMPVYRSYYEELKAQGNTQVKLTIDPGVTYKAHCQSETKEITVGHLLGRPGPAYQAVLIYSFYHELAHLVGKSHEKVDRMSTIGTGILVRLMQQSARAKNCIQQSWLPVLLPSLKQLLSIYAQRQEELRTDTTAFNHMINDKQYDAILFEVMTESILSQSRERSDVLEPKHSESLKNALTCLGKRQWSVDIFEEKQQTGTKPIICLLDSKDAVLAKRVYSSNPLAE